MKIVLLTMTLAALFLTGCTTTCSSGVLNSSNVVLDKHGMPSPQYLVGSGVEVTFEAPVDGHIYLVETNSNKSIIIAPLAKGVQYDFDVKNFSELNSEEKTLLEKEGVNPDNMNFAVYFIPKRDLFKKDKQVAFDENGLPKEEYYIGGGFRIDYVATQPGNLCIVDKSSGKFIGTKSLGIGERFEITMDITDERLAEQFKSLGISVEKSDLAFYFIPTK